MFRNILFSLWHHLSAAEVEHTTVMIQPFHGSLSHLEVFQYLVYFDVKYFVNMLALTEKYSPDSGNLQGTGNWTSASRFAMRQTVVYA